VQVNFILLRCDQSRLEMTKCALEYNAVGVIRIFFTFYILGIQEMKMYGDTYFIDIQVRQDNIRTAGLSLLILA